MKKLIIVLALVVVIITSLVLFTACKPDYKDGDNLVSIANSARGQTMLGFGASSAWWSQIIGQGANKDEVARLLYGDDGMALNIYRYNIGGGSLDIVNKAVTGTYATCWDNQAALSGANYYWELDRLTESFLIGENYTGSNHADLLAYVSNDANYDFTKDAGAQAMLEACYALGNINEIVLFVNSPHYLMTANGMCRSTDGDDNVDNLPEENYDVFAEYLMHIVKYFAVTKGYPVKYLSPINEPNWDWSDWKQEGCHYEPASMAACLDVVYKKLAAFNEANGTAIEIDGYESGNWRWKGSNNNPSYNQQYIEEIQQTDAYKTMEFLSYHSYSNPYERSDREDFMKKSAKYNIKVGISEYCQMLQGVQLNEFGNAQLLALVMAYDMSILKSNEWTWWIGVSNETTYNYEDGLIYTNWWSDFEDPFYKDYYGDKYTGTKDSIRVSPRYYTMKHYANFVDPGDVYLDLDISNKKSNIGAHIQDNAQISSAFKVTSVDGKQTDKMPYSDKIYNAFLKPDGTVVIVYTNVVEEPILFTFADEFKTFEAYTSTAGNYFQKSEGKFEHTYTFPGNSIVTLVLHP